MFKFITYGILMLVLVGCNSANSKVAGVSFGSSEGIVTSGNLRLVTERTKTAKPSIVCTEPSPDYMVAFGATRKVTGSAPTEAGTRSAEVDFATTEEVTKGEGRQAGVLALRDGLYTACQSYANGVIGQDAYAIILSQYGNLLVALVGNEKAAANIQVSGPQAAISAMTVACISGSDPSRSMHHANTLLTPEFCGKLLDGILKKATASAVASSGTKKKDNQKQTQNGGQQSPKPDGEHAAGSATASASTSNITTKTTTETTIKQ